MMNMKRLYLLALLSAAAVTSCYEDYVGDYDVTGVGFANATDVRSVVVGEGMRFSTGIFLGGVIQNEENRKVDFEVDYSLVSDEVFNAFSTHTFTYIQELAKSMTGIKALPASWYTFSTYGGKAGQVIIPKGEHLGTIEVRLDSAKFLADPANLLPVNVIPLRITDAGGATPIEGRTTTVIGVRYENTLFGSWYHSGVCKVTNASGDVVDTISYPLSLPQADTKVWTLTTDSPYSVTSNAIGNNLNSPTRKMRLTLSDDGSIELGSVSGSGYDIVQEGGCRYNKARLLQDRRIYLSYSYSENGLSYHATDTLTFRNRVRDGVNEWQDENQENY